MTTIPVEKTDTFLIKVYKYYMAKGYWPMIFSEVMSTATLTFFVLFTVIVFTCIDFQAVWTFEEDKHQVSNHIFDWHRMKRMNPFFILCLVIFGVFFGYKIFKLLHHVHTYWSIKMFYRYSLKITDFELRTIAWNQVVKRIQTLQLEDQIFESFTPMDAHEIANRIMRKDNYLIALINKDILDFHVRFQLFPSDENNRTSWIRTWLSSYVVLECTPLSKALEWNIGYCLINYFFDENMHVKDKVKSEHVQTLTHSLRMRFRIMAIVNLLLLPFILVYIVLYVVFKYGEQFYKDPKRLGTRNWSRIARWKFREFNELPHVFDERLKQSSDAASEYVNQFPSKYLDIFCKFVVFVLSSFVVVMLFMGLFNAQLFTKDVVWWITMFGTAIALSRVFIINSAHKVYPHQTMEQLAQTIHYIPPQWEQDADKRYVFRAVLNLFEYRLVTLVKEILGVILAPYMLWSNLYHNAEEIVCFFKDCSTTQPGVGLMCEFAMLNLATNGDPMFGSVNHDEMTTKRCKDGKLEKSLIHFQMENPDWTPRGSLALLDDHEKHTNDILAGANLRDSQIFRRLNRFSDNHNHSHNSHNMENNNLYYSIDSNGSSNSNSSSDSSIIDQWNIQTV